MSGDDIRPCIQIEQIPQAHENRRQRRGERGGEIDGQQIATGDRRHAEPAALFADPNRALVRDPCHALDAGNGSRRQKP